MRHQMWGVIILGGCTLLALGAAVVIILARWGQ